MAMAGKTVTVGCRVLGSKPYVLFTNCTPAISKMSVAHISGKASRLEPLEKPKPWPYKERGYSNLWAYFDGTLKRIGENSKVIVVEGPPGVGKTKLAKSIAEELEMEYFPMVTSNNYWINRYGADMRQMDKHLPERLRSFSETDFMKDPKSEKVIWLQVILYIQKLKQYMDALAHVLNTGEGVVLDRCVFSDLVFADTLLDMKLINKTERNAYQKLVDVSLHEVMKPHLVIYLDVPATVVESNLKNRGRGEEKVWNKEVLERLEHNYKHSYLKSISKHAELLAYDWTSPGDTEVIVEDIERIDFDRFDLHDPKMEDWRLKEDWDWNEKRWEFTNNQQPVFNDIITTPVYEVPALLIPAEDTELYLELYENLPGNKLQWGFNVAQGDSNILFKTSSHWKGWTDHSADVAKA